MDISLEEYESLMKTPLNIRNVSIIGHKSHGKSTIVELLLGRSQQIYPPPEEEEVTEDDDEELALPIIQKEQLNNTTTKARPYSMVQSLNKKTLDLIKNQNKYSEADNRFIFNIMDTPGHVDFMGEVSAALRISDGALLVVDCIHGCSVQTEMVIRQAICERVKPILFLNKMDNALLELSTDKEELYQVLNSVILKVNILLLTYNDNSEWSKSLELNPSDGSVIFGSSCNDWAFSIRDFADIYSDIFRASTEKIMDKLWGDDFFSKSTKKWTKNKKPETERGFNMFILDPIYKIINAVFNFKEKEVEKLLKTLKITLLPEQLKLSGSKLIRAIMSTWLNATASIFRSIVFHLPSPVTAQAYRMELMYSGPTTDESFEHLTECHYYGDAIMYVSKMIPSNRWGRFNAFGRVFSGTITTADELYYKKSRNQNSLCSAKIDKTVSKANLLVVNSPDSWKVDSIPAGNWCAISGVDKFFTKIGTISTVKNTHIIKDFSVNIPRVILAAVKPENEEDLPALADGLKRLTQSDVLVKKYQDDAGAFNFGSSGEQHFNACCRELEDDLTTVSIICKKPATSIRETVFLPSSESVVSKSLNERYRLFMTAEPLDEDVSTAIDEKALTPNNYVKTIQKYYKSDSKNPLKIWSFGPDNQGSNLLIDKMKSSSAEIKQPIVEAFQLVSQSGPLCDEPMRGVQFNLVDFTTIGKSKDDRQSGHVHSIAMKALNASFLMSTPRVMEPIFLMEAICPMENVSMLYSAITNRQGIVFEEQPIPRTPIVSVRAHVPITETFGLTQELETEGIFSQLVYDHWDLVIGDPLIDLGKDNKAYELVRRIRKRKGMLTEISTVEDYAKIVK